MRWFRRRPKPKPSQPIGKIVSVTEDAGGMEVRWTPNERGVRFLRDIEAPWPKEHDE